MKKAWLRENRELMCSVGRAVNILNILNEECQLYGNSFSMSERCIANLASWDGEPDKLLSTLVQIKFLDKTRAGYVLHKR